MRAPPGLASLLEDGLIEAVLRPLQSGKEAQVYLVRAGGETCVAKIYKGANERNFKNRSEYQEGRGTRNTRDQRAMKRRSSYGRSRDEDAWQSTEVEMIHRLREAGVRVPRPHVFADGVLVMELVQDADGMPAPRLGDVRLSPEEAIAIHDALLQDVVRMLCAGVVHGDLSEYNVLVDDAGPVIIDLPQAVDASSNQNARKLLLRDVENLQRFVTRWVPGRKRANYGAEMWALYEVNELGPDTELTGVHEGSRDKADTDALLGLIADVEEDETMRRLDRGLKPLATGTGELRVFINKERRPAQRKKKAGQPAANRKAKRQAKPKPKDAPPPSKALSKDELIAQAIAARKAASEAPKASPSERRPAPENRSAPSKRRRRRSTGSDAENSAASRAGARSGSRRASETKRNASEDKRKDRGASPASTDEGRRERRRRPKRDGQPAQRGAGSAQASPARRRRDDDAKSEPPRRAESGDRRKKSSRERSAKGTSSEQKSTASPKRRRRRRPRGGGSTSRRDD